MASEKAILPINNLRITCGYKTPNYELGVHYGTDFTSSTSSRDVYAPFKMKIVAISNDATATLGRTIVAVSVNAIDVHYGKAKGEHKLAVRMWHLASINVKVGDIVGPENAPIAVYGNTGKYTSGAHLHIEFDTDAANPTYTPSVIGPTGCVHAGTRAPASAETTIRAMDVLKVDAKGERGYKQTFGYEKDYASYIPADDRATFDLQGNVVNATAL